MLPSKQLNQSSKNEANLKVLNIFGNKVKHNLIYYKIFKGIIYIELCRVRILEQKWLGEIEKNHFENNQNFLHNNLEFQ